MIPTTTPRWLEPTALIIAISMIAVVLFASIVFAAPQGPTINYLGNSSLNNDNGLSRNDSRGYIHTANLDLAQQNNNWIAYVGNVTGSLTLDDANGDTIYDWSFATITGEVYITRANSVSFGSIACATGDTILSEHTVLGMGTGDIDNINNTFNYSAHQSILVGSTNITVDSCQNTYAYVDDAAQGTDRNNNFQELLLEDGTSLIYAALINDNSDGYSSGDDTYDFQAIVAQNKTDSGNEEYFFYVELG